MTRLIVVLSVIAMLLPSCYRYNTHKGRVGGVQSPHPLPSPHQTGIPAVQYGSIPKSTIPDLLAPITRTVWIKGHRRPNGDYVGDYPLTCVFRKGQFVTHAVPAALIPHATRPPDDKKAKTSAADNPEQHAVAPTSSLPGRVAGGQVQPFHITDYIKGLQDTAKQAGKAVP